MGIVSFFLNHSLMRTLLPNDLRQVIAGFSLLLSIFSACAPNSQSSAGTATPEDQAGSSMTSAPPSTPSETPATSPSTDPTLPASGIPSAGVPDWATIERELLRAQSQCWASARSIFPDDAQRRQEAARGFHSGMLQVIADKHQLTVDAMRAQLPEATRMLPE
jgi:hypothetical protein